jgi:hypothetical protein
VSPLATSASGTVPPAPPGPHAKSRHSQPTSPPARILSPAIVSTASIACDGHFRFVASPNGTGNNYLNSISAVSANDVWAVGNSTNSSNQDRTLAEHWNGTSWSIFTTVNTGSLHNDLYGVSAISSSDVWAVGAYQVNSSSVATIAEHWNGASWSKVTTVNPTSYSYLNAVTAISSSNVWAVGAYYDFGLGAYLMLVEHFDGVSWTDVLTGPNPTSTNGFNQLFSISAFSATDIWAVGDHGVFYDTVYPLALHWNGGNWAVVPTPFTATGDNEIYGVTALEANHAVGVGYFVNGSSLYQGATWDLLAGGGSTTAALSPSIANDSILNSVDRSSGKVFAVGFENAGTMVWAGTFDSTTHTLTWDGSPGSSDNPSVYSQSLYAVVAISPTVFWATGYWSTATKDQTLTEVYCGLSLDVVAPATANASQPFSLTVTAKKPNTSIETSYDGTVHFTSSDPLATLPADYTFVPADAGVHTFTGVVLVDPYNQPSTITVNDVATPFVTDTASITVSCTGACQSPAGTPGGRGTNQSSVGTPGSRGTTQSPTGTSGPRLPRRFTPLGSAPSLPEVKPAAPTSRAALKTGAAPAATVHVTGSVLETSAPAAMLRETSLARGAAQAYTIAPVARSVPVSPAPDQTPWYLLLLLPLLVSGLVLLLRLRLLGRDAR